MPFEATKKSQPDSFTNASWEHESRYWQDNFKTRPYADKGDYQQFESAYRYGIDRYNKYQGRQFSELKESELRQDWDQFQAKAGMAWDHVKDAVRDAYNRVFDNKVAEARVRSADIV